MGKHMKHLHQRKSRVVEFTTICNDRSLHKRIRLHVDDEGINSRESLTNYLESDDVDRAIKRRWP